MEPWMEENEEAWVTRSSWKACDGEDDLQAYRCLKARFFRKLEWRKKMETFVRRKFCKIPRSWRDKLKSKIRRDLYRARLSRIICDREPEATTELNSPFTQPERICRFLLEMPPSQQCEIFVAPQAGGESLVEISLDLSRSEITVRKDESSRTISYAPRPKFPQPRMVLPSELPPLVVDRSVQYSLEAARDRKLIRILQRLPKSETRLTKALKNLCKYVVDLREDEDQDMALHSLLSALLSARSPESQDPTERAVFFVLTRAAAGFRRQNHLQRLVMEFLEASRGVLHRWDDGLELGGLAAVTRVYTRLARHFSSPARLVELALNLAYLAPEVYAGHLITCCLDIWNEPFARLGGAVFRVAQYLVDIRSLRRDAVALSTQRLRELAPDMPRYEGAVDLVRDAVLELPGDHAQLRAWFLGVVLWRENDWEWVRLIFCRQIFGEALDSVLQADDLESLLTLFEMLGWLHAILPRFANAFRDCIAAHFHRLLLPKYNLQEAAVERLENTGLNCSFLETAPGDVV